MHETQLKISRNEVRRHMMSAFRLNSESNDIDAGRNIINEAISALEGTSLAGMTYFTIDDMMKLRVLIADRASDDNTPEATKLYEDIGKAIKRVEQYLFHSSGANHTPAAFVQPETPLPIAEALSAAKTGHAGRVTPPKGLSRAKRRKFFNETPTDLDKSQDAIKAQFNEINQIVIAPASSSQILPGVSITELLLGFKSAEGLMRLNDAKEISTLCRKARKLCADNNLPAETGINIDKLNVLLLNHFALREMDAFIAGGLG